MFDKKLFSNNGENIVLKREGNPPIRLNVSDDLKWAAENGKFWFLGPFRCLEITFDKGLLQGTLELEYDRMTFTTSLNTLNYRDFRKAAEKLSETAKQLNVELNFQSLNDYQIKLTIQSAIILSVNSANKFVEKLEALKEITDEFSY